MKTREVKLMCKLNFLMMPFSLYSCILSLLFFQNVIGVSKASNSSVFTMKLPDDMDPVSGIDKIIYSILDGDRAILNDYIHIMSEMFASNIFKENLKFLSDIRLKCLPKIYFKLRKMRPSDFANCQKLHTDLINVFGGRMFEACKRSESFWKCLSNAKNSLETEYENIEDDIVELYLNEIVGGKKTCMGDIIRHLKIFSELVKKECK